MMNIDEIIEKFPNGKERFKTDALFNKVVMTIAYNGDLYKIIDSLIISNNEITESFTNYILKN
jgi:hypothetical protein